MKWFKFIGIVWGFVLLFFFLQGSFNGSLNQFLISSSLVYNFESKNLSHLFLDEDFEKKNILHDYYSNDYEKQQYIYDRNIYSFQNLVKLNFRYDSIYDCKYWSIIWWLYYNENKDKFNWEHKYITTDNHVYNMIYNDSGYCIADQNNLECINLN